MIRSALSLLTLVLITIAFSGVALAQSAPEFKLGFKALADQIPDVVGTPLESQHSGANGDALQLTTTGLMAWRKADNWTAFTDGSTSWINGPSGVQSRPNDIRFDWEAPVPPPPATVPVNPTPVEASTPKETQSANVTLSSWETYNPDGSVNGKFFANGVVSADKGYQMQDGIYQAFKNNGGEQILGKPVSQEFQVNGVTYQAFEKGMIKFESGQGTIVEKDRVLAPDAAKNFKASPETPLEVTKGDNNWNKTFTFGGEKIIIANGSDIALKIDESQNINLMLEVLNSPESKINKYVLAFPTLKWNIKTIGNSLPQLVGDWYSWPEYDQIESTIPSDKLYTNGGIDMDLNTGKFYNAITSMEGVNNEKTGYNIFTLSKPEIFFPKTGLGSTIAGLEFILLAQNGYRKSIMDYTTSPFLDKFIKNPSGTSFELQVEH